MPAFTMTYPYARDFSAHGLGVVEPGAAVTADENPDPNFFEAAPEPAPEPPATPPARRRPASSTTTEEATAE